MQPPSDASEVSQRPHPALVLIVGPIAGGKSTVAAALAARLRARGEQVALVGLDEIAEMALPTLPNWDDAHAIFSSVVGQWLRTPLTVVVAEGPSNRAEIHRLLCQVPDGVDLLTTVLTSDYDVAIARALADPTRGVSKDPEFLSRVYDEWRQEMPAIARDVLIDTGVTPVEQSVDRLSTALDQARAG